MYHIIIGKIIASLMVMVVSLYSGVPTSSHSLSTLSAQGVFVQPGQEVVLPYPIQGDPHATLHLRAFIPHKVSFMQMKNNTVSPNTIIDCVSNVGETISVVDQVGWTLVSHTLILSFCTDGTDVTTVTIIRDTWQANLGWTFNSRSGYTTQLFNPSVTTYSAINFTGPFWQHLTLWVEVNMHGDGSTNVLGGS